MSEKWCDHVHFLDGRWRHTGLVHKSYDVHDVRDYEVMCSICGAKRPEELDYCKCYTNIEPGHAMFVDSMNPLICSHCKKELHVVNATIKEEPKELREVFRKAQYSRTSMLDGYEAQAQAALRWFIERIEGKLPMEIPEHTITLNITTLNAIKRAIDYDRE